MKFFDGVFVLSLCLFDISVGKGAFVIEPSQVSTLFSFVTSFSPIWPYNIFTICKDYFSADDVNN